MLLRLLPEWTSRIAYLTPFPHMLNSVVEIYLGVLTGQGFFRMLLLQLFWVLALATLAHLSLRIAVKRLVLLGGKLAALDQDLSPAGGHSTAKPAPVSLSISS